MRTLVKPVVKVYLLPGEWSETEYQHCFDALVKGAQSLEPFRVKTEDDIIILFPKDGMQKGLGTNIVVEIDIPSMHGNYDHYFANGDFFGASKIADTFFRVMQQLLPNAYIQCRVNEYDDTGFRMSPRDTAVASEEQILSVLRDHGVFIAGDIIDKLEDTYGIWANFNALLTTLTNLKERGVLMTVTIEAPFPFSNKKGWKLV